MAVIVTSAGQAGHFIRTQISVLPTAPVKEKRRGGSSNVF